MKNFKVSENHHDSCVCCGSGYATHTVTIGNFTHEFCEGCLLGVMGRLARFFGYRVAGKEEREGTIKNVVALPIALCDDCARRLTEKVDNK